MWSGGDGVERTNHSRVAQEFGHICVCVYVCACVCVALAIIHTDRLHKLVVAVFVRVDMLQSRPWQNREETSEPCFMQASLV